MKPTDKNNAAPTIRIASRESALALAQTHWVAAQLRERFESDVSILGMTTRGDQILDKPLAKIGGKGLFIKELEVALAAGDADIAVVDPQTQLECEPAIFDEHGALVNADLAIGEIVNRAGGGIFEGYYNNPQATADRLRNGWYWTGDLAYVDAEGYYYFAGRSSDWLRVDSENFAAAPIENILHRFPGAVMVAVYAIADPRTGDQVMAAIEMSPGVAFDPLAFDAFVSAQRDLGPKWAPRFVRLVKDMPLTANNKVNKQPLRSRGWATRSEVWWRPARDQPLVRFTAQDATELAAEFAEHGRSAFIPR